MGVSSALGAQSRIELRAISPFAKSPIELGSWAFGRAFVSERSEAIRRVVIQRQEAALEQEVRAHRPDPVPSLLERADRNLQVGRGVTRMVAATFASVITPPRYAA